jgi:hypothetical protein
LAHSKAEKNIGQIFLLVKFLTRWMAYMDRYRQSSETVPTSREMQISPLFLRHPKHECHYIGFRRPPLRR